jgi:hypothetical protein
MWTMLRKYLPDEAMKKQAEEFETGAWVRQHGVHAQPLLDNLVKALQLAIDLYNTEKYSECNAVWVQQVGDAQRLLPAHVVNEYCHPTRSFGQCPNFKEVTALPRTRESHDGEWFTATYEGGGLGNKFAFVRDAERRGAVAISDAFRFGVRHIVGMEIDHETIRALRDTRTAQREKLINELKPRSHSEKGGVKMTRATSI